jgi:hypothetical protein
MRRFRTERNLALAETIAGSWRAVTLQEVAKLLSRSARPGGSRGGWALDRNSDDLS